MTQYRVEPATTSFLFPTIPSCHRWRGRRYGWQRRSYGANQEIPSHGNIYPLASCINLDLEICMMLMNVSSRKDWSLQRDLYSIHPVQSRSGGNASVCILCKSSSYIINVLHINFYFPNPQTPFMVQYWTSNYLHHSKMFLKKWIHL